MNALLLPHDQIPLKKYQHLSLGFLLRTSWDLPKHFLDACNCAQSWEMQRAKSEHLQAGARTVEDMMHGVSCKVLQSRAPPSCPGASLESSSASC